MTTKEAKAVIPEAIQRELDRIGWTWYRLGIETGISHSTISNIRNGVHDPKISSLKSIADALDVSVDSLLNNGRRKTSRKLAPVA